MSDIAIEVVSWANNQTVLKRIRRAVFVREQKVPESDEWDDCDTQAVHLLAVTHAGEAAGTARILANDKITRMAVMADFRGQGIGSSLLDAALALLAARGAQSAWLHAQADAQAFYQARGFEVTGESFVEAGIVHVPMARPVCPDP